MKQPPKIWRERRQRYFMEGIRCNKCGKKTFPSASFCPECGSENLTPYKLEEKGKILYFTISRINTQNIIRATSSILALIELDDGLKITAQIVDIDPDNVKRGMRVKNVFRILSKDEKDGLIQYGLKFSPV